MHNGVSSRGHKALSSGGKAYIDRGVRVGKSCPGIQLASALRTFRTCVHDLASF